MAAALALLMASKNDPYPFAAQVGRSTYLPDFHRMSDEESYRQIRQARAKNRKRGKK